MLNDLNGLEKVRTPNVLSIQSHVVHGYVGNKAATFPLQYRGWDVDILDTVQLSNHPGYGKFTGFRSKQSDISDILKKGLFGVLNMKYNAILTGYIPCTQTLQIVAQILGKACQMDTELKWILDPVLGDNGRLYVSEENIPVYKSILRDNRIFLATPNQFEMETLTDMKINSLGSLKQGFLRFHKLYPLVEKVVITSMEFPILDKDATSDYLVCACYDLNMDPNRIYFFKVPKLNALFSGSGDLFTALLLDVMAKSPQEDTPSLKKAVSVVLSLVDNILQRTMELTSSQTINEPSIPRVIRDLKLINCADILDQKISANQTSKFKSAFIELS